MNDMTAIVDQQTTTDVSKVDVIYAHWDIYRKIEERFKQIFSFEPLSGMLLRLNNLRMDSSTDDPNNRWDRIDSSYAPLFYQVDELSTRVVRGVFKGSFMVGTDEVESYKKDLHDMQMILWRFDKQWRKRNRPVSLSLLTPGTKVEYQVRHVDKVPRIVTIAHVSSSNMGYAVITTEDTYVEKAGIFQLFPHTEHYHFNSSWILRVVQHAKGLPLIKDARGSAEFLHQRFEAHSQPGKSRRAYCVGGESSLQFLLQAQIEKMGIVRDPGQAVDLHRLGSVCRRSVGGVRERLIDDYGWNVPQLLIRKRKFKRWVRQNVNRFLFSRSVQEAHEREYQKEMDRMCGWDD